MTSPANLHGQANDQAGHTGRSGANGCLRLKS